jgi:hypothetical protein
MRLPFFVRLVHHPLFFPQLDKRQFKPKNKKQLLQRWISKISIHPQHNSCINPMRLRRTKSYH